MYNHLMSTPNTIRHADFKIEVCRTSNVQTGITTDVHVFMPQLLLDVHSA